MLQKAIAILSCLWLSLSTMAMSSAAQNLGNKTTSPVLDTAGQPLESGVEYYIKPAITDNGGNLTLKARNGTLCPLYVGQEPVSGLEGSPVTFTPFFEGEDIIREGRDFKVVFQAFTICIQPTQWRVGETEPVTGRRLIATGIDDSPTGFFRIDRDEIGGYNLVWCPSDVCPTCRPRCGAAGVLIEEGVRLLALDGSVLPFEFDRATVDGSVHPFDQ